MRQELEGLSVRKEGGELVVRVGRPGAVSPTAPRVLLGDAAGVERGPLCGPSIRPLSQPKVLFRVYDDGGRGRGEQSAQVHHPQGQAQAQPGRGHWERGLAGDCDAEPRHP